MTFKAGDRVRVNEKCTQGIGSMPVPGSFGTVESVNPSGTIYVRLNDGRRALLASWEVDLVGERV